MSNGTLYVSRVCVACGEEERDERGNFICYQAGHLPVSKRCHRCGLRMLVADSVERKVVRVDKPVDWTKERARIGRPPKAVAEARRIERNRVQRKI